MKAALRLSSALLLCILFASAACSRSVGSEKKAPLRCAVDVSGLASFPALRPGYNYELLGRFAESSGREARIRLASRRESLLDSLREGKLDIIALPYTDSIAADSTLLWRAADSCGIWVFSADSIQLAREAGSWFRDYRLKADYALVRQPFMDIYNPLKRVSADFISPYDSLIRVWADTLGWDWKLLAAVIYQESKFHIEARSQAGARGLMQLLPASASKYGCEDLLNPVENIRAGALMLKAIRDRYSSLAATPSELCNFTLAAYNAGTGRIGECIDRARKEGLDASRWDNVAAAIPLMQQDSTRKVAFSGRETVAFVRQVNTYHKRYQHICP